MGNALAWKESGEFCETYELADCLRLLDWTPEQLAKEINRACGMGTISVKAPYHWLKGSTPRRRFQNIVAGILSMNLCRTITARQLWPEQQEETRRSAGSWPSATDDKQIMDEAVRWMLSDHTAVSRDDLPRTDLGTMLRERVGQWDAFGEHAQDRRTLQWLLHDLRWASSVLSASDVDATVRHDVARSVTDLGRMAGWLLLDHGRLTQGKACLHTALRAAFTGDSPSTVAHLLSCLSYIYLWQGMHQPALQLVQIARRGIAGADPEPEHAVLDSRQARVHAARGEVTEARRSIDQAFARLTGFRDTPPVRVERAIVLGDAGRSWLDAGLLADAERDLTAVSRRDTLLGPRNRLLHLTSLGHARFERGEVEGAAAAVDEAVEMQRLVHSSRAELRLRNLYRRFAANPGAAARATVAGLDSHFGTSQPPSIT